MPVWDPSQLQDIQWGYLQPVRKTVPVNQIPFLAWVGLRMDVSLNLIDRQWAELPPPPRKLPFITALQQFEPIAAAPQRFDPTIYNDEPWVEGPAVRLKTHASRMPFEQDSAELLRYNPREYIDKQWSDPRDIGTAAPGPASSLLLKKVSVFHYPSFGQPIEFYSPNTDYYQDMPWEDGQAVRYRMHPSRVPFEPIGPEVQRFIPATDYVDRQWNDPQALRLKMHASQQFFHTRNPTQFSGNEYYLDKQWTDPRDMGTAAPGPGSSISLRKVSTIHYPSFGIPTDFYTPDFDEYVDRPWQWNDPQALRKRAGIAQFTANDLRWPSRPPLINIADLYQWPEPPRFRPQRLDRQNNPIQVLSPFFFGPPRLLAQNLNWWAAFPDSYRANPRLPVDTRDHWHSNYLEPFYVDWFMPFAELRAVRPAMLVPEQLVSAYLDEPDAEEQFWFMALSEPRRFKPGLIAAARPDTARNLRFFYKPSGRGYIVN